MLEEALSSINNKNGTNQQSSSSSSETAASMMLSFIQSDLLPAGGVPSSAASEQRFFRLFGPLMENIFGGIVVHDPSEVEMKKNDAVSADDQYRHQEGGWLSAEAPWRSPSSSLNRSSSSSSLSSSSTPRPRAPVSLDADPVVKLLGGALPTSFASTMNTSTPRMSKRDTTIHDNTNRTEPPLPTLIEALSKESETRPNVLYSFPLHGLPNALQDSWLHLVSSAMAGNQPQHQQGFSESRTCTTSNDIRLLNHLLRNGPLEQQELIRFLQHRAEASLMSHQQQHSTSHYHYHHHQFGGSVTSPRQPFQAISPSNARSSSYDFKHQNNSPPEVEGRPSVMLDMLEYYLFVFVRFPLSMAQPKLSPTVRYPNGVNVHHRVSRSSNPSIQTSRQQQETYGETLYYHIFRRYLRLFLPYDSYLTTSETNYLRSISFGTSSNTTTTTGALRESELFLRLMIALWLESPTRLLPTAAVVNLIQNHLMRAASSFGNITPKPAATNFDLDASFDLVQTHSLYKYDPPTIQIKRCLKTLIVHALLDPAVKPLILETVSNRGASNRPSDWCLSGCMTALQLPLYNYIRATFRHASIHAPESPFYVAFSLWLMWLEPWNVFTVKKYSGKNCITSRNLKVPGPRDPNLFDKEPDIWEPYVVANLYMYLVPLAIFLRRARELDFSAGKFDRSVQTVHRAFRVFSPPLIQVLRRYLGKQNPEVFSYMLTLHEQNLGDYGPPLDCSLSMQSYKIDMESLLEEIDMQHVKKVRELNTVDRCLGWIEGWFGKGVVSGEEKLLDILTERAKLIANLPLDYDFLHRSATKNVSAGIDDEETKYRNPDGTLTDYGRQQLLAGAWKCDPSDVVALGDPMRAKVQSYEIPIVVTATLLISDHLNQRFQLVQSKDPSGKRFGFRFNLRFLADYRNIIFFTVLLFLWKPRWFLPF